MAYPPPHSVIPPVVSGDPSKKMEVGVAMLENDRDGEVFPTAILSHSTRLRPRSSEGSGKAGEWFAVGTDSSPWAQNDNSNTMISVIPAGNERETLRNKTTMDFSASQEHRILQTGSENVEKVPVHPLQLFISQVEVAKSRLHSIPGQQLTLEAFYHLNLLMP